jgi:hypothetical protein
VQQLSPTTLPVAPHIAGAPRAALPLDVSPLKLAKAGARIGLTGRIAHLHDESLLMTARTGRPIDVSTVSSGQPNPGRRGGDVLVHVATRRSVGGFLDDVLATYYFAGSRGTLIHVLITALVAAACILAGSLFVLRVWVLVWICYVLLGVACVIALQFYWNVLSVTAVGDDELPLVAPEWDWWDDAVRPTALLLAVTVAYTVPVLCIQRYVPADTPGFLAMLVAAGLVGSFLWPMAVVSTAISGTLLAARPDLAVRNIIRIGPAYLVAWLALLATLASWFLTYFYRQRLLAVPFAGSSLLALLQVGLTFYYGYCAFRIFGLLYRHFEAKMVWR